MRIIWLTVGWAATLFFTNSALAAGHAFRCGRTGGEAWDHRSFGAAPRFENRVVYGKVVIRASGREAASGLSRDVDYRPYEHPWLEWDWRVNSLQSTADIRTKQGEDLAAAIFLIFGRPGFFRRNVPTLVYVWTNDRIPKGTIVPAPRHSGGVQYYVLQSGAENLGQWIPERRHVVEDYRRAFGKNPPDRVKVVTLWTDSDQTGEFVEAFYGSLSAYQ